MRTKSLAFIVLLCCISIKALAWTHNQNVDSCSLLSCKSKFKQFRNLGALVEYERYHEDSTIVLEEIAEIPACVIKRYIQPVHNQISNQNGKFDVWYEHLGITDLNSETMACTYSVHVGLKSSMSYMLIYSKKEDRVKSILVYKGHNGDGWWVKPIYESASNTLTITHYNSVVVGQRPRKFPVEFYTEVYQYDNEQSVFRKVKVGDKQQGQATYDTKGITLVP